MKKVTHKLLTSANNRDKEFIKRFCSEGAYIGEGGKVVNGVCRTVDVEEILTFLHRHDALLLQNITACPECGGEGEHIIDGVDHRGEHTQRVDKCLMCDGTGRYNGEDDE